MDDAHWLEHKNHKKIPSGMDSRPRIQHIVAHPVEMREGHITVDMPWTHCNLLLGNIRIRITLFDTFCACRCHQTRERASTVIAQH